LLSGIAWDHVNVFPTFENYLEQFRIFVDSIIKGGSIVYNEEDVNVKSIVEGSANSVRKLPYSTPDFFVEHGKTFLNTGEGPMPLEIFGHHNLNNLAGAKWICQNMGIDEEDFYQAIPSFKGASKRLEKIGESNNTIIFKDYAHSPSKVAATTKAVKEQFPDRKLIACLELHTYSSLNAEFLKEYRGSLKEADVSAVFYIPESVKIKGLAEITKDQIGQAFQQQDINIFTNSAAFKDFLFKQDVTNSIILFMSSGNYGGLDLKEIVNMIEIN
jgi:UDP-N-acetylmuramate: L-alanyl-gamma-D-glutamyl-meso-diaminopimelate ligase